MPPQGEGAAAAAAAAAEKPKPPPAPGSKGLAALLGHGDDEECEVPACRTMVDVLKRATGAAAKHKAQQAQGNGEEAEAEAEAEAPPVGSAAWRKQNCPLGKEALGDATWGFLHSTAAYYPDKPTEAEQGLARSLIQSIAAFYPCGYCRKDFQKSIASDPPRVESRSAFAVWLCQQHNRVNDKLGKPPFTCDMAKLDQRWRTGDPKCWEGEDVSVEPIRDDGSAKAAASKAPPGAPAAAAKAKIIIIEPQNKEKKK